MVFTNFCIREGRVLKACTREGRFFGDKCVLERVGFFKEFVSTRVTFWHYVPVFLWYQTFWTSEIVSIYIEDFNG